MIDSGRNYTVPIKESEKLQNHELQKTNHGATVFLAVAFFNHLAFTYSSKSVVKY